MEIKSQTIGNFTYDWFSSFYMFVNKFVPLYVYNASLTDSEFDGEKGRYYTLPSFEEVYCHRTNSSIKNITKALELSLTPWIFEINGNIYYIMKGVIFNAQKKPVLIVVAKDWKPNDIYQMRGYGSDYTNYILFYSTTFLTDPNLAAFNRRLQKSILLSCFTKGMEVRIIDPISIEKNTFARILEPTFKSISEMTHHLRHVLPLFLKDKGEDTLDLDVISVQREENEELQLLTLEEEARQLGFTSDLDENSNQVEVERGQETFRELLINQDDYTIGVDPYSEGEGNSVTFVRAGEHQQFVQNGEYLTGGEYLERNTFRTGNQLISTMSDITSSLGIPQDYQGRDVETERERVMRLQVAEWNRIAPSASQMITPPIIIREPTDIILIDDVE